MMTVSDEFVTVSYISTVVLRVETEVGDIVEEELLLPPPCPTSIGPRTKLMAKPEKEMLVPKEVAVTRSSGGNQSEASCVMADIAIGPANPFKNCPKWMRMVAGPGFEVKTLKVVPIAIRSMLDATAGLRPLV